MAFALTEEQSRAVHDRGGGLLVSAAAGSGKTRVLVERLLDRVTREGLDLDRFLVITYTKAAAAELRTRIAQELSSRLAENPGDRHLRRQSTLVYRAQISTIHAFCSTLLREEGHRLDLDPDFRLCDEGETQVLMAQVLEDVLEEQYEGIEPDSPFAVLVDTLSAGRDDSRLAQIVLDVFGRIQSHPDPAGWLADQSRLWELDGVTDAGDTPWGALLLADARRQGERCLELLLRALELTGRDSVLSQNYGPSLSQSIQGVRALLAADSWDGVYRALPVEFPAAGRKKGVEDLEAAERVKGLRTRCKKQMDKLFEDLGGDSGQLLADLALARPAVRGLMELTARFQEDYAREKARRGVLDFSDLEHLALRLLTQDGDGGPGPLARYWSGRFAEVMVDEYQDTNQVQNAIFTAVSDGGRKLFMVGDVKQSIYRFRLADPTIFLDKYRRFKPWDQAAEGEERTVVLTRNFRSRPEVLEGTNDLFQNIMSTEFGELDYTQDQALAPGAAFPPEGDWRVELDLEDLSFLGDQEEGERADKNLLEARWAARRIRELLDGELMLTEGSGQRRAEPSDVLLLLRSPGAVLHHYIRALNEAGLPWSAEGGEDFFASTEINVALSLLQIVDNPRQDVALIAALRSAVYGFSGDQLALLRAEGEGDFYSAVVQAAGRGDQACRDFLTELEELRFGAGDRTCRQLIWHIYERTNLLGLFGAMPGGQERQDNLLSLYALAGELEDSGCRSLFQFLLRLERIRSAGGKFSAASSAQEGEGVSILSIHRSKGLECPVVLVCGLSRRFNRDDLMRPVLFHAQLGVGPKGLDRERMVEYPTLARKAVARKLEREMMAEELRLLYVAMTRAKEKLILSIPLRRGAEELEKLGEDLSVPPSPMALERQQSVGGWVLLHALARPEASALRSMAGLPEVSPGTLGPAWDIRWVDGAALAQIPEQRGRFADLPGESETEPEGLREALAWHYPFSLSSQTPSKLTATQLKGRSLDQETREEAAPAALPPQPLSILRPQFVAEGRGLTPAQRGTALHLAMQYLPLDTDTPERAAAELERLVSGGFLTPQQGAAADPGQLSAFFNSPLGREMASAPVCRREFKFSVLLPAEEFCPGLEPGEEVLLQGVVDAWFETLEGITVVDFKSDRVSRSGAAARGEEYRPQLEAYSRALEEITGKQVVRKALWFFEPGELILL
mgnify:CR=1 FL=1